jgi:small subunit ribosomal protein S16
MLAIRMQRTGRKGHAMFRVIVQDARLTPTSGKVVAFLGQYDPHAKTAVLDKEKAATFLKNGAQPSERAAMLLKKEGVKLPSWVVIDTKKAGKLRNPEKLRKNRPAEPVAAVEEVAAEEPAAEAPEAPAEEVTESPAEKAEEVAEAPVEAAAPQESEEKPAEEPEAPEAETKEEKEESKKA